MVLVVVGSAQRRVWAAARASGGAWRHDERAGWKARATVS